MSYDLIVYTRRERIPETERLATELRRGARLDLLDPFPASDGDGGEVGASFAGKRVTVGVMFGTIAGDEAGDLEADIIANGEEMTPENQEAVAILRTCDTRITLSGHTDEEVEVARSLAAALATASLGYLCDPQADTMVGPPA